MDSDISRSTPFTPSFNRIPTLLENTLKRTSCKPWLHATASIALIVLVLSVASLIVQPKNNQASFGQIDPGAHGVLGERRDSIDVLFLGDSEVYTAIAPLLMWQHYGFTSYDISTSAQPLPYAESLLNRALTKQSPRVVVIETNMLYRKVTPEDVLWRKAADIFPVLEYHNRWKSLGLHDFTSSAKQTWTDPNKGFQHNDAIAPSSARGYMKPSQARARIPHTNEHLLTSILAQLQRRGIKVVLLSTPSTLNWSWKRHNAVEDYLAHHPEFDHVTYLDLNLKQTEVPIDWSVDTRDRGDHLNTGGARKVSTYLGAWLQKTYQLPDRRQDGAFHSWNEALKSSTI